MGGSSPPFLYDPPSTWSFDERVDSNFNPKVVTQASWSPRQPRPQRDGPLVNLNRHPDSWGAPRNGTAFIPMSPRTKIRVKRTRLLQLLLRVTTLIGALGALFCVICINGTGVAVGWIIRVAPAVAILHIIYAIYHLCRSPSSRPPASTASYMLFASSMDAGLIPFYSFTSFVAYRQYTENVYNWGTLFNDNQITYDISHILFLVSAVCGGLHVVSLGVSVYLAIIFRQIAKLPPDMNPLEDNLTARSHKRAKGNKAEVAEKHLSSSTIDSSISTAQTVVEDPLMGEPRTVPFMHTRQGSLDMVPGQHPLFHAPVHSHRLSRADRPSQQHRLYEKSNQSNNSLTRSSANRTRDTPSRMSSIVLEDVPVLRPSSRSYVPTDFRWGSPVSSQESDNWVTYPSPSTSPVNENIARQLSPIPSRTNTPPSLYSGVTDWLGSAHKHEQARGEYSALQDQENYANDGDVYEDPENTERDLGERYHADASKAANPLAMNPPTPQPIEQDIEKPATRKGSLRRFVLSDIANPSAAAQEMPPITSLESKGRFYGELESRTGLSIPRAISKQDTPPSTGDKLKTLGSKKLWRRKSGKSSAYESLKAKDDEDDYDNDSDDSETPQLTVKRNSTKTGNNNDTDRKGRVVSNSGIDLGTGFQLGTGSDSYGNYISGLGVGRRRDREVSGKVVEEGRGRTSIALIETEENTPEKKRGSTIRAAGWARFAGM